MTDLGLCTCMKGETCSYCERKQVTHDDLAAETKTVLAVLNREMEKVRDQLYLLNKIHTVAMMAAELYGNMSSTAMPTFAHAARCAKQLYREVQETLEIDDTIVSGHITGE